MKRHKSIVKFISTVIIPLLCTTIHLAGCQFTEAVINRTEKQSEKTVEEQQAKLSEELPVEQSEKDSVKPPVDSMKTGNVSITKAPGNFDVSMDEEKETEVIIPSIANQGDRITQGASKDLDHNGIMDEVQLIWRNDDSESLICIYFNNKQIFEFRDPNLRIISVEAFEYLDLDEDDINEIFVAVNTNANSRPLMDVLCLKESEGRWNPMDIPINDLGNNGFSFRIIRGKSEFDHIISSEDTEERIQYDASPYFVDDENGNIDSIQAYRSNHYKEGDEVGFISPWGIWGASTGTFEGRNCIIALQGIEGPYGHGLGQLHIYFAYDEQGAVEILKFEHLP